MFNILQKVSRSTLFFLRKPPNNHVSCLVVRRWAHIRLRLPIHQQNYERADSAIVHLLVRKSQLFFFKLARAAIPRSLLKEVATE